MIVVFLSLLTASFCLSVCFGFAAIFGGRCWNASASITARQYPASLFLIYAGTPPHFALAGILCMKSKEACEVTKRGLHFPVFAWAHILVAQLIFHLNSIFALLKKKEKTVFFCFGPCTFGRGQEQRLWGDLRRSRHMLWVLLLSSIRTVVLVR